MSIDFANRSTANPTDPNAVVSVQPSQNVAWIKTDPSGAWQGNIVVNETTPGPGYRSVGYATVTLNDGRQFRAVLDGEGQPISEVGDQVGIDDKQHSAFTQQANASTPNNGAQTQRQPDGTINQWDPNGLGPGRGGYTIPRPDLSPAGTIQTPQQKREEAERQKNAALPPGQDPRSETDAERAARGDAVIKQQGEQARQATIDAQNAANVAADNKRADDAAAQTRAIQNRPTVTIKDDGKGGLVSISTDPNTGQATTSPIPGVQGKPDQVTVQGTVYERGADGNYAPAKGIPQPSGGFVDESSAPQMSATPGQMTQGLQAYSQWLNGQVTAWKQSGGKQGISPTDATSAMDRRLKLAESMINENNGVVSTQASQRGQDITQRGQTLQDTSGRRTAAETTYNAVLNQYLPLTKYLAPGKGGDMAAAMQESLQNAIAYQNQYGGLRDTPEIAASQFPALAQARQAAMAGITQAAATPPDPAAAVTPPAAAAAATPPQPAFAPPPAISGAPVTPPPPAAAVNPISAQPITVPATPQAAAMSPTVPTPSALPPADEFGRMPSPVVDPHAVVTQNGPGVTVYDPVTNPGADESQIPGFLPDAPAVGGPPDYGQPGMTVLPPPAQTPVNLPGEQGYDPSQPLGMRPSFLPQPDAQQQPEQYDPHSRAAALASRLGIAPDILAAAFHSTYGMPFQPPAVAA